MKLYSHSDALIAHNSRMKDWLLEKGARVPIVTLGIFDCLPETRRPLPPPSRSGPSRTIVFAGALGKKKTRFLYDLPEIAEKDMAFHLYGKGFDSNSLKAGHQNIHYKGFFPPDELMERIEGSYGLVWDGDSIDTCEGFYGRYLYYNNPHKCSFYLLCGLPVIIWKRAAMAEFVEDRRVGVAVSSLRELPEALRQIDCARYREMQENVLDVREGLSKGRFLQAALAKAGFP